MSKRTQRRGRTATYDDLRVELVGVESKDGKTEMRLRETKVLIAKLILSASQRGRPRKVSGEESYAA